VFEAPEALEKYVVTKGSIAVDGVSLTVNEVEGRQFGVNIIPHTQKVTTFAFYEIGTQVNLEVDMLARYVARLVGRE
jgi:riboflavin synthase